MDATWQVAGPLRVVHGFDRPVAAFLLRDCPQPILTANMRNNNQKRKENEIRLAEMCLMQEDKSLFRLSHEHSQAEERTPGFSHLHIRKNFPEMWETMLFWYSSA